MDTIEQNRELAIRFVESMGSNDAEAFASTLAPDAVAVAKGTTNFAGARNREMMIGGVEMFKQILPEGLQFEVTNVIANEDGAAVECKGNGTTSEGKAYCNDYCFVLKIRDGKVAHVNEFFCTKLADEVLWPMVEGTGSLDQTVA